MAVQVLISQVGPLPITAQFNAIGDSPMYIEVQGSVWTQTANVMSAAANTVSNFNDLYIAVIHY